MATYSIKQGESKAIEIAIYEDNLAVDLSLATDIRVTLYTKQVAGPKFALGTVVGYGSLTVKANPDEHILVVELTREDHKALDIGALYASVVTKESSIALADGLVKEYTQIPMGTITSGGFVKDEVLV